jgi:hypothetical protein
MLALRTVFLGVLLGVVLGCSRGDTIGVRECDDYVAKYEACLAKMGPAAKAKSEPSFRAEAASLKEAAADPAAARTLALSCRMSMDAIRGQCP